MEILIGSNFDKLFLWDVSVARWAKIKGKAMAADFKFRGLKGMLDGP